MKNTFFISLIFLVFVTKSVSSQKNSIRIQTGLFHFFFDKSPILNVNHPYKGNSFNIFNGFFINSFGLVYDREIKNNHFLDIEITAFNNEYRKNGNTYPIQKPIVYRRDFYTFGINYSYKLPVHKMFKLTYGTGFNYRFGLESVIVNRIPIINYSSGEVLGYELLLESVKRNDFGINLFTGIEFTPKKWITLYSKIDLLGFILIGDKPAHTRLKTFYNTTQFPTRLDLSFKFGIGFNFGK